MQPLRIEIDDTDRRGTVVRLIGEGHLDAADDLDHALSMLLQRQLKITVVDMTRLRFAASLIMGCLIRFQTLMRHHDGVMKMAGLQGELAEAFHRARLDMAIPTFPDVEQALA